MHKKNFFFFPYKLIWISVHLYLLNLLIQIMEFCYFKSKFCQGLWLVYMKSSEATYLVSTRELSLSLSLSYYSLPRHNNNYQTCFPSHLAKP